MNDTLMSAMIYLSLGMVYLAAGGLYLLANFLSATPVQKAPVSLPAGADRRMH